MTKNKSYQRSSKNHFDDSYAEVFPSIYLCSKRWIVQFGIGLPLLQNLNGEQDKIKYLTAYTLGIGFQF